MAQYDNFNDPLVEEVLTDVANNFFGVRRELENMTELFYSYAEKLRIKEAEVGAKAGLLNYLLLNGRAAGDFYRSVSIDLPENLLNSEFSYEILPVILPYAFTAKGEFIRLVLHAYNALQRGCDEYINGKEADYSDEKDSDNSVYYKLIMNMCDLVNQKINTVNSHMSPRSALQYVKNFNSEILSKEQITGGMTFGRQECDINQKLAFQPIDFNSLKLKKYPELPEQYKVSSEIILFCKKLYSKNKQDINNLVSRLKSAHR